MPAITLAQAPEGPGVQLDPRARLVTESRGANNGLGADGNPLSIEAGQADGKGEIAIKLPTCKSGDEGLPILKHVLKITAPTDKNSEITDFTNVDGLAKDLTVGYSFRTLLTTESSIEELMDDFDGFVLEHEELTGVNDLGEINELVQKMDVEEQERWRDIYAAAGRSSISWFVDGSLSHNQYEFFDQDQAEQDANKMGISLKTGLSFPLRPGRLSFAVGFQRAFKDNDTKAQVCTEVEDAPGFESCKELPIGEPDELEGAIGHLEFRFPVGDYTILSPLVSYNDAQDAWGVQLPIYIFRKKGTFSGGFRMGWRSDEDKLVASVFVSKPLDFQ
jgi:hypothetical protein